MLMNKDLLELDDAEKNSDIIFQKVTIHPLQR